MARPVTFTSYLPVDASLHVLLLYLYALTATGHTGGMRVYHDRQ